MAVDLGGGSRHDESLAKIRREQMLARPAMKPIEAVSREKPYGDVRKTSRDIVVVAKIRPDDKYLGRTGDLYFSVEMEWNEL